MLTLTYEGHTLLSVPSIHYRVVFAEMVNRCCADAASRPTAIAVELPPHCTAAAAAWIRELMSPTGTSKLPCMLGLIQKNRKIHPRFREAALRLQERTGKQLHELSPDILYRELGHSAVELLCLSPTDSIIEAIRCACELQLPLFGIDMDETPPLSKGSSVDLRDPQSARQGLQQYVDLYACLGETARDQHSFTRREVVMSARLKTLLLRYERVLFVCGLGHCSRIFRMINDHTIQPARDVPLQGIGECSRVLVHPDLAIKQMDIFPGVSEAYATQRQPASRDDASLEPVNFTALFQSCLDDACSRRASEQEAQAREAAAPEGYHGIYGFSQFLARVGLLSQQITPDLATTLGAAQSMLPQEFVKTMVNAFMKCSWVSPSDYPDLPIVGFESMHAGPSGRKSERCALIVPTADGQGAPYYEKSESFHLTSKKGQEGQGLPPFLWQWQDEPNISTRDDGKFGSIYIWPPCDYLYYATSYAAVNLVEAGRVERASEAFTGSLFDGIDLKASLRASIQGEAKLYVRRPSQKRVHKMRGEPKPAVFSPALELQPTVFIFSGQADISPEDWNYLIAGTEEIYNDLSSRGKKMFDQIETGHNVFLESINVATELPILPHMSPWVSNGHMLHGSLRFGNPCVNYFQASSWLEKGHFKSSPSLPQRDDIFGLVSLYADRHNLEIDLGQWGNALILFALPYAINTRKVIVVAPENFQINAVVRREAKRRQVEIISLPISIFPKERISQIRCQYSVRATPGGKEYPPELEHILGQSLHTHRNLLPREIRRRPCPDNELKGDT